MASRGRNSRKRNWADIEARYGRPVRDVILYLRQQGHTWMGIATEFGIREETLIQWRKSLGIGVNPSHHNHEHEATSANMERNHVLSNL